MLLHPLCALDYVVFLEPCLGLMHILISFLSFLLVATIEDTQSGGSEIGVMTPNSCILSSSALTWSFVVTGMQCAGRTTGLTSGSSVIEFVTGSFPNSFAKRSLYSLLIC